LSPISDGVLNNSIPLDPTDGMLDPNSDAGNGTIALFVLRRQFLATWFLLGLNDGDSVDSEALKTSILKQGTSIGKVVTCFISSFLVTLISL
jgi:hypothetical protein